MIKTVEELKELILFCKKEKVSEVSIGDLAFRLSDIGLVENIQSVSEMEKELNNLSSKTITDDLDDISTADKDREEEEALFWSTNT